MSYPDQAINLETDARVNRPAPPIDFAVNGPADLARLRELWSELPTVPKLLATRDQGVDASFPGVDVRALLRGEESAGLWSVHSIILPPGGELPAHTYEGGAYWFVIGGEPTVTVGTQTAPLGREAAAYVPAKTTQAIANRSDAPAEVIVAHTPAGPDRAFAAAHALAASRKDSKPGDYLEVLARHGLVFTGGAPQAGDGRVNADTPRLDGEIGVLDDYLALRDRWRELTPTAKLVRSPHDCYRIPIDLETWVMVRPEESAAQTSVFQGVMTPGEGAPPHHQPVESEFFFVQRGVFRLTVGTQTDQLPPGGFGFAPPYCTHTFGNDSEGKVAVATINSPGGHDRGFELGTLRLPMDQLFARMPAHGFQFHF